MDYYSRHTFYHLLVSNSNERKTLLLDVRDTNGPSVFGGRNRGEIERNLGVLFVHMSTVCLYG